MDGSQKLTSPVEGQQDYAKHMIPISLYTPLCFFFSIRDYSTKDAIVNKLKRGFETLSKSFPWLACQVVRQSSGEHEKEPLGMVPLEDNCRLIVKDLEDDSEFPSLEALRNADYPCSLIDGEALLPLVGLPNSREDEVSPVFFGQVTFIKGGLVLSLAGEHSEMDGQGIGQVVNLLSKACHGEPFTHEELAEGNRARNNVIPLLNLDVYKPGPELDYLVAKPAPTSTSQIPVQPPKCTWAYTYFSSSSLAKLKNRASHASSVSDKVPEPYITTNDALSAFIWQCTTRARLTRFTQEQTDTVFGRAVDCRSALSMSSCYLGNMSNHTYTKLPVSSILESSLNLLASLLRSSLSPESLAYGIRSLVTQLHVASDKSSIHYGANMNFSHDLFFSSWARLPSYHNDFDLGLGFPEAVRRPGFLSVEGLMYLLPMDRTGGVTAMICLRDEDLINLREDSEFGKYARWVG